MAVNDLIIRLDASTSQYDVKFSAAQKTTLRYEAAVAQASTAAEALTVAVTETGAASERSAAAQATYSAALQRASAAQERAAIASKRAAEQMVADQTAAATATERAAAKEIAAVDAAAKASTNAALAQARAAASTSAAVNAEVLTFERAAAKEVASQEAAARATEAAATKRAAALKSTGSAFGVTAAASAVSLFLAAKAAAGFNAKMAQVQSLTRASADTMALLSDATKNYADLGISATQAADAEIELVKAGISVKDIMGGALTGTINLAAAGQLDVGTATNIAAQAMTQFQLSAKDVPHLADLLAAGADKALGSVQDLGEGLKYSGLLAHQSGLSIDETVGALAEFAQAGLIGSQGGTALQQVLRQLIAPTDKAKAEIQALGLSLYDSKGNFVGLSSVAGQLHDKLGPLTQQQQQLALNTIFTSRAVRGATILFQDGSKGVDAWQQKVQQAGFAAEQAHGKMDSLSGDWEKLKAAAVNMAISFGQQLQGPLRTVTKDVTRFLEVLNGIPDGAKSTAVQVVALAAAIGLGVFAYSRASAGIASLRGSLGTLRLSYTEAATAAERSAARMVTARVGFGALGAGLMILNSHISDSYQGVKDLTSIVSDAAIGFAIGGPWGAAIGGAAGVLGVLTTALGHAGDAQKAIDAAASDYVSTLAAETGAVTADTRAMVANRLEKEGILADLQKLGINSSTFVSAITGDPAAIRAVNDQLADLKVRMGESSSATDQAAASQGTFGEQTKALNKYLTDPSYYDKVNAQMKEQKDSYNALHGPLKDVISALGTEKQGMIDSEAEKRRLIAAQRLQVLAAHPYQVSVAQSAKVMTELGLQTRHTAAQASLYQTPVHNAAVVTADLARTAKDAYDGILKLDNEALGKAGDLLNYKSSIQSVTTALKDAKTAAGGLGDSVAGLANQQLLQSQAAAALKYATSFQDGSKAQLDFLKKAHAGLVDQAIQFGKTRVEAEKYVDTFFKIPAKTITQLGIDKAQAVKDLADQKAALQLLADWKPYTTIGVDKKQAEQDMAAFGLHGRQVMDDLHNYHPPVQVDTRQATSDMLAFRNQSNAALGGIKPETVPITLSAQSSKVLAQLGGIPYATGGAITGGIPGQDSVPILSMPGEWVIRKSAVDKYGDAFMSGLNAGQIPTFGTGGPVSLQTRATGLQGAVSDVEGMFASLVKGISAGLSAKVNAQIAKMQLTFGATAGLALGNGLFRPVSGPITQGLHDEYTGFPAIDIGVPVGTPIHAGAAGRVTKSEDIYGNQNGGYASYGRYIQLLSNGFSTLYAHLSGRGVAAGQQVAGGQTIGLSGDTGNSTGPHLHFGAQGIDPNAFYNTTPIGSGLTAGLSASGAGVPAVRAAAARYGWASGLEWTDLVKLVNSESSFNPYAQNPTSTAYGLFQFLDSTWATVGGRKTSDAALQAAYGMRYVQARYGDPIGAWNFHLAHGYYDRGGEWPNNTIGINTSGHSETVIPHPPAVVERMLSATPVGSQSYDPRLVAAVNAVGARVAHLEARLGKGLPVDVRNPDVFDGRSRRIARDEVDQGVAYQSAGAGLNL